MGSVPRWGTKIPYASDTVKKKQKTSVALLGSPVVWLATSSQPLLLLQGDVGLSDTQHLPAQHILLRPPDVVDWPVQQWRVLPCLWASDRCVWLEKPIWAGTGGAGGGAGLRWAARPWEPEKASSHQRSGQRVARVRGRKKSHFCTEESPGILTATSSLFPLWPWETPLTSLSLILLMGKKEITPISWSN